MKGSEMKFVAFMQGSAKRFVIPVYQRNYDWKTENCKQLYDDLIKVIKNDRRSHFFGSIVSVYNPYGNNVEFLVIDGQQRLTTISLLLLAMYNLMEAKLVIPQVPSLSERIYEEYLIDKWQDKETRIKLKPVKNDQKAFAKLFDEKKEHIPDSNLTINYDYFYNRIQKEEIKIDELFDAICRLEIISITLNPDDNPQLIFESLNSTGLALSEGDKIRNFILMGQPTKLQNEYYEKYWNKIEKATRYDVSAFIRDYLSAKQQSTPSMSRVYAVFKEYVEDENVEVEDLLQDLKAYAEWYNVLLGGNTPYEEINACIYRLNRLETTVTRPFFLEILRLHNDGKLTIEDVTDIFIYTENYILRRAVCDLPTNMLNKIFLTLNKEIIRFDGTEDNYVNKFKYALLSKKDRSRFPDDDEFIAAFSTRPIYQMYSKNKIYILERFENYGIIEDKDVYRHVDNGVYSIEHIMPQHLTSTWVKELGEDNYEEIHETWLHRLANLTLTGYNSKYSNSDFEHKKNMEKGFRESGLRLNTYIASQEHWGLPELEARNDMLMARALEIWKSPVTAYKPAEKQLDSFTLDDDISLTGRSIAKFMYKNQEQPVISWVDMFERVLKILHSEDKSVLSRYAYSLPSGYELSTYVSNKDDELRSAIQIDEDIFVERNTSTEMKLALLRRFFKQYNADPNDLIFFLKDENDIDEELVGTRFEVRKKYWAFALPYIKEANAENSAFANANPRKENWLSGFFGIGGFNICCVANIYCARVELNFVSNDKENNKAAFDYIYGFKKEIEDKLGVYLNWIRNDDAKGSNITYQLQNVSINNEADWLLMAKFHAEWSQKFMNVFIPYLKSKF